MSQNITACLRRARLCLGNRPPARAVFTGCGQAAGEAPRGGFPAADARLFCHASGTAAVAGPAAFTECRTITSRARPRISHAIHPVRPAQAALFHNPQRKSYGVSPYQQQNAANLPETFSLIRSRLRYLVSRWALRDHLFCW